MTERNRGLPSVFFAGLRFLMGDVHAGDEAVAELVRMVDDGVEQEVALLIVDNLVYFDHPSAVYAGLNANGFDMRIEGGELTCPVSANLILSMDVASFHDRSPIPPRDA